MKSVEKKQMQATAVEAAKSAGAIMSRNHFAAKKINESTQRDIKLELDVQCQRRIESMLTRAHPEIAILDVRPPEERAKAALDNSRMLDNHTAQEILDSWDPETPMMLICHQGIRSRQAAQYFTSQGFQQVYNVSDGIDGWSQTVDSSIPRY